jgi:uncharacterized protein with HEPN domain
MKRDNSLYLNEILEQVGLIQNSFSNRSKEDLGRDLELRDATIRRIEIIGEAVKQVPKEIKLKYPNVEWKSIAGARDNIIHRYFNVDLEIIWNIVNLKIPELRKQIEEIIEDLNKK